MTDLTTKSIISRNQDFYSSEVDDEAIMMNINNNSYYTLDNIGNTIWQMLETETSCEKICDKLVQQFDVTKEQCQKDTLTFLNQLLEHNAIK